MAPVVGFTTLVTSQVISIAFYSEREKSDKICSEALISAWGTFTCGKSTTRDPRLYFPPEGSHNQDFLRSEKIHRPRPGLNLRTSDPVASMITTWSPGSKNMAKNEGLPTRESLFELYLWFGQERGMDQKGPYWRSEFTREHV